MSANARGQSDWITAIVEQFSRRLPDPAQPLTIVARLQVKEGAQARFEAAFARARERTLNDTGVITYELNRDDVETTRFVVYERWRSLPDLEAHLRTDHIAALINVTNDVLAVPADFTVVRPVG